MLPLVTHTKKRQIWFLSNEKLHTCNRSYFRGNGMHPTNLPFTGPTWFSTSTTKPGRGSGPGQASPRHVGCAAAILPGGGGAAQPGRCLWAATALRAAGAPAFPPAPYLASAQVTEGRGQLGWTAGWAVKLPTCTAAARVTARGQPEQQEPLERQGRKERQLEGLATTRKLLRLQKVGSSQFHQTSTVCSSILNSWEIRSACLSKC